MPRPNPHRRRALADAAVTLLAQRGAHGLTHRSVEARADVPAGTATNYFRSREGLLVAAAERIVELHVAEAERATGEVVSDPDRVAPSGPGRAEATVHTMVDLLSASLWTAATALRDRYLAVFELQMEARRSPRLAAVLGRLEEATYSSTVRLHEDLGTLATKDTVATLGALYAGALFTLVTRPVEQVDRAAVRALVEAMVRGAFARA
ncbi:TetR/AcrR family transcriptional regulator [Nocardiopsis sp. NPDC006938]|uniref:TetR/AcrR family transcriptional regulator n=1 Tax=Nocardiopsis sp. NPDC006938 TaxID=3364337 RepID=UPI0036D121BD